MKFDVNGSFSVSNPPEGYQCEEMLDERNDEVVLDEAVECYDEPVQNCFESYDTVFTSHQVKFNSKTISKTNL